MDPNTALATIISLANSVTEGRIKDPEGLADVADDLSEMILSLDDWITSGGFLPSRWER